MTRHALIFALGLLVAPSSLFAQVPPRIVEAVPAELAGVVRDSLGNPLNDADVSIPALKKQTRTGPDGKFALIGIVPTVAHEVWFRHIGYESVRFEWTGEEGKRVEVSVTLRHLPNTLDPVVVWANETKSLASTSSIAGMVVDSAGVPVADADVQLIGADRTTRTAADGSFIFRHVIPGTLTLRARLMGFAPTTLMIELQADDQRDISLRVRRLAQMLDPVRITEESGYGRTDAAWQEFGKRERWRSRSGLAATIGPQRLREAGSMPLDWLLRPYEMIAGSRAPTQIDPGNGGREPPPFVDLLAEPLQCILENGIQPRRQPLGSYSADEVDRIEYYPPAPPEREYTGTVEARMRMFRECARQINGGHPAYYVLWLKNAR